MSLYGLALLSDGGNAEEVASAHAVVAAGLPGLDAKKSSEYWWAMALGSLFLSEAYLKEPSEERQKALADLHKTIVNARARNGGWPVGPSFNHQYDDVAAHTCLMTFALSRLQRCGIAADENLSKKFLEYLKEVTYEDGPIEYNLSNMQDSRKDGILSSHDLETAARNASALLALVELGLKEEKIFAGIRDYYDKHMAESIWGHASHEFARLVSGLACYRLGGDVWKRYRQETLSLDGIPARPRDRRPVVKRDPDKPAKKEGGMTIRIGTPPGHADRVFSSIKLREAVTVILLTAPKENLKLLR